MPRPTRVDAPLVFRDNSRIDPLSPSVRVDLSAEDAWQLATSSRSQAAVRLLTSPIATYRLLLGYYTDRPSVTDAPGQPMHPGVQHVASWIVVGHHMPTIFSPGPKIPGRPPRATTCGFVNQLLALDANTGRVLGGGTNN